MGIRLKPFVEDVLVAEKMRLAMLFFDSIYVYHFNVSEVKSMGGRRAHPVADKSQEEYKARKNIRRNGK